MDTVAVPLLLYLVAPPGAVAVEVTLRVTKTVCGPLSLPEFAVNVAVRPVAGVQPAPVGFTTIWMFEDPTLDTVNQPLHAAPVAGPP